MLKEAESPVSAAAAPLTVESRKITPVKWFASVGAFCWLLEVYLLVRWAASGDMRSTPTGINPVPEYQKVAVIAAEIIAPTLALLTLYFFVVKPWRRDRSIGSRGILCFAMFATAWQDFLSNYFNPAYTVNAYFINLGSWYNFIPGWSSPRASHLPEPLLYTLPAWIWAVVVPGFGVSILMRKAKLRWPQLGTVGLLTTCVVGGALADIILEVPMSHLGLYGFVGAIPSLTLFAGHAYQFPVYEAFTLGAWIAAYGALLYFRDDNGYTVAERGVDRISGTNRRRNLLRFLGLSGFSNIVYLCYNAVFAFFTLLPSFTWASDVTHNKSYLRDELCGPGTTYACPQGDVPVPRQGSIHLSPDGKLIVPTGTKLPSQ